MGFIKYNRNPYENDTGDCIVRALSVAMDKSWDEVYIGIAAQGFMMKIMPSFNVVWRAYLKRMGFKRYVIPDTCPDCYSVREFCKDHPLGTFVLATGMASGDHVVAVKDGNYIDTWDSGNEIPVLYWEKGGDLI